MPWDIEVQTTGRKFSDAEGMTTQQKNAFLATKPLDIGVDETHWHGVKFLGQGTW